MKAAKRPCRTEVKKKALFPAAPAPSQNRPGLDPSPLVKPIEVSVYDPAAPRPASRRRLLISLLLITALVVVVGGGAGLIAYLSLHPIYVEDKSADPTLHQPTPAPRVTRQPSAPQEISIGALPVAGAKPELKAPAEETGKAPAEEMVKTPADVEKGQKVRNLIASGQVHEEQNNLAFALADYQAAVKADSGSVEARKALERVKQGIVAARIKSLMSEGMTAYHRKDYSLAKKKLSQAGSIEPQSKEIRDALAQVDTALELARIDSLHLKAREAEAVEDWERALLAYQAALVIEPSLEFAARGRERCDRYSRWVREIGKYLENPSLLESDRGLAKALELLKDAGANPPEGPRFADGLSKLEALVHIAQVPVKVVFQSDNLTDVAVYKVGRLGQFEKRELALRPGTYTVVGGRPGYKDVRRRIRVAAGETRLLVTVKCTEKI